MPEDKEKGLAIAILRKKDGKDQEEDKKEESEELEMAAKNILSAQKSGDVKEYASALKEFIHMCGY